MKVANHNNQKTAVAWKRILILLCAMAVITVVSILAYDGYSWGEVYGPYTYGDNYVGDTPTWHDYHVGEYHQEYTGFYNYDTDINIDTDTGQYPHYYHGDIGEAPTYAYQYNEAPTYDYHNDNTPQTYYEGQITIEVDNDGNINIYPPNLMPDAVFSYNYLLMRFPMDIYTDSFELNLPYGWTYTVSHDIEEHDRQRSSRLGPHTLVRIRHTWNDTVNSYIGFQPLAINAPGHTVMPAVDSFAGLFNAITSPGGANNRLIPISGWINQTATIEIPAGRSIVIASQGTDFRGDFNLPPFAPVPPAPIHTLNRQSHVTTGRHFDVFNGSTLILGHIILEGGSPPVGINGGGISVNNSHLYMLAGSHVRNNRGEVGINVGVGGATGGGGGGVSVMNNSTFTLAGGTISGNSLTHGILGAGGGVAVDFSQFTMTSGNIINNHGNAGGGVRMFRNSTFYMSGGTISGNIGSAGGGVRVSSSNSILHTNSTFTMTGGYIRSNTATYGGGVSIEAGATFDMQGGTIYNNRYNATGGVITSGGGVHVSGINHPTAFTVSGGTIGDEDSDIGNRAVNGGGVWLGNGASFYMQNSAPIGGGPPIPGTGLIEGNHATNTSTSIGGGGGVYMTGLSTTFHMFSGWIRNNIVADPGTLSGLGGGVSVADQARFYMYGGEIYGHENTWRGGGVYIARHIPAGQTYPATAATASTFTMNGGIIRDNISNWGGGVANIAHAHFNMHGGYIRNNHAIGEEQMVIVGGGIVNISGPSGSASLTMTGGTIEDNTSLGGAGGMWINPANLGWVPANDTEIIITGGTIRNNIAYGQADGSGITGFSYNGGGGGIFFTSEPRHGTTFGGPTLEIYGNRAYGETGGGGIKVHAQHIVMTQGVIRDNFAYEYGGGVLVFPLDDHLLSGEIPGFTMHGGTIYNNDADRGGGVAVHGGMFTMQAGTIGGPRGCPNNCTVHANAANCDLDQSNTAIYGGGVWVGDDASFHLPGSATKNITGNNATNHGGGVWVHQNGTMSTASGVHITHNQAITGDGGGIFTQRWSDENPMNMAFPAPYSNLTLTGVTFNNNTAVTSHLPPSNALTAIASTGFNTPLSISTHPLNNWDINYHNPGLPFRFTKKSYACDDTDCGNSCAQCLTPVVGAVFRMYRWDVSTSSWLFIGEQTSSATGFVEFTGMHPRTNTYRLVEVFAPYPYQRPTGHWTITWAAGPSRGPGVREVLGNPAFGPSGGVDLDTRFVRNSHYPDAVFRFTKTDNARIPGSGIAVPGAEFQLYRWDADLPLEGGGTGGWAPYPDPATNPPPIISDSNGHVHVPLPSGRVGTDWHHEWLVPGVEFKLREIAPPGFLQPLGHWLIRPTYNFQMQRAEFEVERVPGPGEPLTSHTLTPELMQVIPGLIADNLTPISGLSGMVGFSAYTARVIQQIDEYISAEVSAAAETCPIEVAEQFAYYESIGILERVPGGVIVHGEITAEGDYGDYMGIMPLTTATASATWNSLRIAILAAEQAPAATLATSDILGQQHTVTVTGNITAPPGALNTTHGNGYNQTINISGGRNVILRSSAGNIFTLTHSTVPVGNANSYHFIITGGSRLLLENITISGCRETTTRHGGIRITTGGNRLTHDSFNASPASRNTVNGNGRVIIGAGATIAYNNQVADNGIVIAHGGIIELRAGGVIRDNFSDGSSSGVFLFGTNPTTANGYAYSSSIFLMSGGEIRNNETSSNSGGIGTSTVGRNHHIYMMGGVIRDNIAMNGGGVSISSHTTFMMEAGEISGNHATGEGGGVVVNNGGRFIMHSGARIVNNRAELDGGGIMFRVPATFYSALYANPLDPNIAGVFDTLDIRQGAIFYGNTARNWALPPTILPAVPPAIVVNQLNNVRWNAASDSSSVWLCTNEDCNNCTSTANQHTDCNGRYLYLLNNYDINFAPAPDPWFLGNIPTWPIYKTDMAIYNTTTFADRRYLPGAFFSLLVYNGTGTPPLGIITNDMIGPAANQWTYVTTLSSGTIGGPVGTPGIVPMRFPMLQGRVYQLEEIVPPTGFQPPYGQWRITIPAALGTASNPSARILENISTTVGGAPPVISRSRQVAGSPVYSNYIGNMSDFNLPLTGGEGSNLAAYAMAGTVVICMAFASFGVMKVVKGKKVRKG